MEKSRLAQRDEKLTELEEKNNAKALEVAKYAKLAEQVKVIEDSQEI